MFATSNLGSRFAAAAFAFALSIVTIAGTVTVPADASTPSMSAVA